jgi:hypothetical protein
MVFRYFRTMLLRLIDGVEQNAVHSTASMLHLLHRSQPNLNIDISPPLYTRAASVAPATPFKRDSRKLQTAGACRPPARRRCSGEVGKRTAWTRPQAIGRGAAGAPTVDDLAHAITYLRLLLATVINRSTGHTQRAIAAVSCLNPSKHLTRASGAIALASAYRKTS